MDGPAVSTLLLFVDISEKRASSNVIVFLQRKDRVQNFNETYYIHLNSYLVSSKSRQPSRRPLNKEYETRKKTR